MVAIRQVEIPFNRGIGRQRERGFRALVQNIGKTASPFLRKFIIPAAKRVGADLLEFAVPEIADVAIGRESFNAAAKSGGRQTLRNQLGSSGREKTGSRVIPTKSGKQTSRWRKVFLHLFLINHVEQFSVPTFSGSFWKFWRESHSSRKSLVDPRTGNLSLYRTR